MSKYILLKWSRVVISLTVLLLITISFLYSSSLSYSLVWKVLNIEFIPSLLSLLTGGIITFLFITLITLLFGRVYCSFMCPLGVYQDIVINLSNRVKTKKRRRFHFDKGRRVRYYILFFLLIAFAIGWLTPLTTLDPYSIWGRVTNAFVVRGATFFHNILATLFPSHLFFKEFSSLPLIATLFAATLLAVVTLFAFFKGRLYCNSICPVGTFLGMLSRFSLFKPTIAKEFCTACHRCAIVCKASCIDLKEKTIDSSRCILCFNCMTSCPKGGITLSTSPIKFKGDKDEPNTSLERRRILLGLGVAGGAVATNFALNKPLLASTPTKEGIAPPGALSIDHLKLNCTACHACISACLSTIIKPAIGEYGLDGLFLPVLSFDNHYCAFECTRCSEVCPNNALLPITKEKKQITAIAKAKFSLRECIVYTDHTDCGACEEHCPTKAITMIPYKNSSLLIPHLHKDECIGCGACEYICPATPIKAMKLRALSEHQQITPKATKAQKSIKVDSFGF